MALKLIEKLAFKETCTKYQNYPNSKSLTQEGKPSLAYYKACKTQLAPAIDLLNHVLPEEQILTLESYGITPGQA